MISYFLNRLWAILLCYLLNYTIAYTQNLDNFQRVQYEFFNAYSTQVLVAAHRGTHSFFPENSLSAIAYAIKLGVDIVEVDVRLSRDGVPVLMHDSDVDRTTNGKGMVEDLMLRELKQLYLVNRYSSSMHRIPSLKEALDLAKGNIMVDLDLKVADIEPIIDIVKKTGTETGVIFFNSNFRVLKKFKIWTNGLYLYLELILTSRQKRCCSRYIPQ